MTRHPFHLFVVVTVLIVSTIILVLNSNDSHDNSLRRLDWVPASGLIRQHDRTTGQSAPPERNVTTKGSGRDDTTTGPSPTALPVGETTPTAPVDGATPVPTTAQLEGETPIPTATSGEEPSPAPTAAPPGTMPGDGTTLAPTATPGEETTPAPTATPGEGTTTAPTKTAGDGLVPTVTPIEGSTPDPTSTPADGTTPAPTTIPVGETTPVPTTTPADGTTAAPSESTPSCDLIEFQSRVAVEFTGVPDSITLFDIEVIQQGMAESYGFLATLCQPPSSRNVSAVNFTAPSDHIKIGVGNDTSYEVNVTRTFVIEWDFVATCVGCNPDTVTLLQVPTDAEQRSRGRGLQEATCECLPPTTEDYALVLQGVLLDLIASGQLQSVSSVNEVYERVPVACDRASAEVPISGEVFVALNGPSPDDVDLSQIAGQVEILEDAFMEAYNTLNLVDDHICDPDFKIVLEAKLVVDGQALETETDGDETGAEQLSAQEEAGDGGTEEPVNDGGEEGTEGGGENEGRRLQDNRLISIGVLFRYSGTCIGCDPTVALFAPPENINSSLSDTRRDLSSLSSLANQDENYDDTERQLPDTSQCYCPFESIRLDRSPTEAEFLAAFQNIIYSIIDAGGLSFVASASSVIELQTIGCDSVVRVQQPVSVPVTFGGNPSTLTAEEVTRLEVAFQTDYNEMSQRTCDPFHRRITNVQLGTLTGDEIPAVVEWTCRGCDNTTPLFDDPIDIPGTAPVAAPAAAPAQAPSSQQEEVPTAKPEISPVSSPAEVGAPVAADTVQGPSAEAPAGAPVAPSLGAPVGAPVDGGDGENSQNPTFPAAGPQAPVAQPAEASDNMDTPSEIRQTGEGDGAPVASPIVASVDDEGDEAFASPVEASDSMESPSEMISPVVSPILGSTGDSDEAPVAQPTYVQETGAQDDSMESPVEVGDDIVSPTDRRRDAYVAAPALAPTTESLRLLEHSKAEFRRWLQEEAQCTCAVHELVVADQLSFFVMSYNQSVVGLAEVGAVTSVLGVGDGTPAGDVPEQPTTPPVTAPPGQTEAPTESPTSGEPLLAPSPATETFAPSLTGTVSPTSAIGTSSPVSTSTSAPTMSLLSLISAVVPDGGASLSDPATPQSQALGWMLENPYDGLSEDRKLQRYAIAVLFFSTKIGLLISDFFPPPPNGGNECSGDAFFTSCNDAFELTSLNLFPLELEAERLPPELGLLTSAEKFTLAGNRFGGGLDPFWGGLQELQSLNLTGNELVGTIPVEWGQMLSLEELDLRDNNITGSVPTELCSIPDIFIAVDCDEVRCPCCSDCQEGGVTSAPVVMNNAPVGEAPVSSTINVPTAAIAPVVPVAPITNDENGGQGTMESPAAAPIETTPTGDDGAAPVGDGVPSAPAPVVASGPSSPVASPVAVDRIENGPEDIYIETNLEWRPLGELFGGDLSGVGFGYSLSFSGDANALVVGSERGGDNATGIVQIFAWDGGWQDAAAFSGSGADDLFGKSLQVNSDGNLLVVGAPRSGVADNGAIHIFAFGPEGWAAFGETITGATEGGLFGSSVAVSTDGRIIAASAPGSGGGDVLVYGQNEGVFTPLGSTISGNAVQDGFGQDIVLSGDGRRLCASAPGSAAGPGYVRCYELSETSNDWEPFGSQIDGRTDIFQFGQSIGMSEEGDRIAIGSIESITEGDTNGEASVSSFIFQETDWTTYAPTLEGFKIGVMNERGQDVFSMSCSSSCPNQLLVGSPGAGAGGVVALYSWDGAVWIQIAETVQGSADIGLGVEAAIAPYTAVVAVGTVGDVVSTFAVGQRQDGEGGGEENGRI